VPILYVFCEADELWVRRKTVLSRMFLQEICRLSMEKALYGLISQMIFGNGGKNRYG